MPDLRPFLVLGLALGGVFALSGVGLVVLFRATGVLNLAYGAVGALGALIAWSLINSLDVPEGLAYAVRDPLRRRASRWSTACSSVHRWPSATRSSRRSRPSGLTLILLGIMSWAWSYQAHVADPADDPVGLRPGRRARERHAAPRAGAGHRVTVLHRRLPADTRGWAWRCARWPTIARSPPCSACPVRRVEAAAWLGSGLLAGATGLLLSTLVGLDIVGLTFLVIAAFRPPWSVDCSR